jgi:hypothetical protein
LIATAAAAGLAFAWIKTIEPYRLQREAMAVITKLGGSYKTEDAAGWVRYLDKDAQDVVVVDLADCDKPEEYLPHLLRLPRLRTLVVGGHSVGDDQVTTLERAKSLKGLVLDSTKASDATVEQLRLTIPDLFVHQSEHRVCAELDRLGAVRYVYVADALPRPLPVLPDWLCIDVGDAYFNNPTWIVMLEALHTADMERALAIANDLPMIATLKVDDAGFTDERLARLELRKTVAALDVRFTSITDDSVSLLESCNQLMHLNIGRTRISPSGVNRLKAALPKCDIRY